MPHRAAFTSLVEPSCAFEDKLNALDLNLFETIYIPGHGGDAQSLLALHAACRVKGAFAYLEIGSHLGASLQSFLADPLCHAITSIDPRPTSQPDDLAGTAYYPDNSTERMLEHLREVPEAELSKLRTLEASAEDLSPTDVNGTPNLCLIDGEHTYAAALRDARFCREIMGGSGAVVFHDRRIVARAISDFVAELEGAGAPYLSYPMPSEIFVVELGEGRLIQSPLVAGQHSPLVRSLWSLATTDRRRPSRGVRAILGAEAAMRTLGSDVKHRALSARLVRRRRGWP